MNADAPAPSNLNTAQPHTIQPAKRNRVARAVLAGAAARVTTGRADGPARTGISCDVALPRHTVARGVRWWGAAPEDRICDRNTTIPARIDAISGTEKNQRGSESETGDGDRERRSGLARVGTVRAQSWSPRG